jgi:hypothetical protein
MRRRTATVRFAVTATFPATVASGAGTDFFLTPFSAYGYAITDWGGAN